jgi:hypothetical protein
MGSQNGSRPAPEQPPAPRLDADLQAALGELHGRVLVLDAEWRRLGTWLSETRRAGETPPGSAARERRYLQLCEELRALRAKIAALRARADPEGRIL